MRVYMFIILCIGWNDDVVSDAMLMEAAQQAETDYSVWNCPTDTQVVEIVNSIEADEEKMALEKEERKKRARSLQRGKWPGESIL